MQCRQVLRVRGAEEETSDTGYGEDLLDGDGSADESYEDQGNLIHDTGPRTSEDRAEQHVRSSAGSAPDIDPGFVRGRRDGIAEEASEESAPGHSECECGEHDVRPARPPVRGKQPEMDGEDDQQDAGEEELRKRRQGDPDRPRGACGAISQHATTGRHHEHGREDDGDRQRGAGEGQRHSDG
ncbi:MAG: hypothetical protein ABS61_10195 [Microbacterium sp. SCN 70-18]|nr:MAG: hypothetical protein ABS61_10195 [Microbacterium sp. SCN 70-18]